MDDVMILLPDDVVRRVAGIVGPQGSASLALADVELRRAAGEDACIYERSTRYGSSYVVGPRIRVGDAG